MRKGNRSKQTGNGIPVEAVFGRWVYIVFRYEDLIGVKKFSVDVATFQKIRLQPENGIALYEEYVLGMIDKCQSDLFEKAQLLAFLSHLKTYTESLAKDGVTIHWTTEETWERYPDLFL